MERIIIGIICFLFSGALLGQSCFPQGITLSTQDDIDNFSTNFPNCTIIQGNLLIGHNGGSINNLDGLSQLTMVNGSIDITSILASNLNGLHNISHIGSDLNIVTCVNLESLNGLENITSFTGDLSIFYNESLINISALSNLNSNIDYLTIYDNDSLVSLDGLQNITRAEDGLIADNDSLSDLNGLNGLAYVNGFFVIDNNHNLLNIESLINLTTIQGVFDITRNDLLLNLNGLESLSIVQGGLYLSRNPLLNNVEALSNLTLVGDLKIKLNPSLTNFNSLNTIDSVRDLIIEENNQLIDVSGLSSLNFIYGELIIKNNNALTDLSGLNNVSSIGQGLEIIDNSSITHLDGFESLSSIDVTLNINGNNSLTDITGLLSLASLEGGDIKIEANDILESINGLDNIDQSTISKISLLNSTNLTFCDVQSICAFLETHRSDPSAYEISNNANGCLDAFEVADACGVILNSPEIAGKTIKVYPNPTKGLIIIGGIESGKVRLINLFGQVLLEKEINDGLLDINSMPVGVYFIQIDSDDTVSIFKVIKE